VFSPTDEYRQTGPNTDIVCDFAHSIANDCQSPQSAVVLEFTVLLLHGRRFRYPLRVLVRELPKFCRVPRLGHLPCRAVRLKGPANSVVTTEKR